MIDTVLVTRWKAAYEKANDTPAPKIQYNCGWYRIGFGNPLRHLKLERMTEVLEARVIESRR